MGRIQYLFGQNWFAQIDSDSSAVLHVLVELLWLFRWRREIWQSVCLLLVRRCGCWSSPALYHCQLDTSCQCLSMVSKGKGLGWVLSLIVSIRNSLTSMWKLGDWNLNLFSRGSFGPFAWRRSCLRVFCRSDFRPTVGFYKSWGLRPCWYKNT